MWLKGILLTPFFLIFVLSRNYSQEYQSQSNIPYFSYGKGLGMTSPDSLFSLNIRFRIQNRIALTTLSQNDFSIYETEALVRRLRLRFDGFFYTPRLTYVIQLSFAAGDIGEVYIDRAPNILRDAMIFYEVNEKLTLGFGQTKLPGNRQRVNSSGDLQLVDRSVANATFNIDRDFGIQAYYNFFPHGKGLILKGAITSGEGRNWESTDNSGFSYTLRAEYYPFGDFLAGGAFFEGDILMEETPKLMAGIACNFNDHIQRVGGQLGQDLYEPRDMSNLITDVIFKYKGWAIQGEYLKRFVEDPVTVNPSNGDIAYIYKGDGFNIQASKYFPSAWEIIGRYSEVRPDNDIIDIANHTRQTTLGVNRYIKGHRLKLQADATYNDVIISNQDQKKNFQFRFQVELGI